MKSRRYRFSKKEIDELVVWSKLNKEIADKKIYKKLTKTLELIQKDMKKTKKIYVTILVRGSILSVKKGGFETKADTVKKESRLKYYCQICDQTFKNQHSLDGHNYRLHKDVIEK